MKSRPFHFTLPLWSSPASCAVFAIAGIFTAGVMGMLLVAGEPGRWIWMAGVVVGGVQGALGIASLAAIWLQLRRKQRNLR